MPCIHTTSSFSTQAQPKPYLRQFLGILNNGMSLVILLFYCSLGLFLLNLWSESKLHGEVLRFQRIHLRMCQAFRAIRVGKIDSALLV